MEKFADGTEYEHMMVVYPPRDLSKGVWDQLCDEQSNDSYRQIYLWKDGYNYPPCRKVINWLKGLGIKEEYVFVSISY